MFPAAVNVKGPVEGSLTSVRKQSVPLVVHPVGGVIVAIGVVPVTKISDVVGAIVVALAMVASVEATANSVVKMLFTVFAPPHVSALFW